MKKIEQEENKLIFSAELEESLANTIRRYLNKIPVNAIEEVEISKNDSPLYDETIAHRVGLIPLKTDKPLGSKEEILELEVKREGLVFSGDFKGKIKIVYDKIPITSLNKNQEIKLKGIVKEGIGSNHAKFSPGMMFYRNIVEIKIDKDCPKEVVGVWPKKILENENGKIIASNTQKCDMCEACVEFCKKQKKDSITLIPTKELIIDLESFGQIEPQEMFKRAIEILKKDLEDINKKLK
jgi:DNA-directed RNA polymerase subunit D